MHNTMQNYDFINHRWSETPRFILGPLLIPLDNELTMYARPGFKMFDNERKWLCMFNALFIMLSKPNNNSLYSLLLPCRRHAMHMLLTHLQLTLSSSLPQCEYSIFSKHSRSQHVLPLRYLILTKNLILVYTLLHSQLLLICE